MIKAETPERLPGINLPEWVKLLLSNTNCTGEQLYFSERLKAMIYKGYIEYLGQALHSELLNSVRSK